MKESTIQLKILAGVPILKDNTYIKESKLNDQNKGTRIITKIIKNIINLLDDDIVSIVNREDKIDLISGASDLEDILAIVKSGKQKKARKLYSELDSKIKSYIISKLDSNKAESLKKYFMPVTENCSYEDEEELQGQPEINGMDDTSIDLNIDHPNQSDNSEDGSDMVQCPFSGKMVPRIDFYDHIMNNYVEDQVVLNGNDSTMYLDQNKIDQYDNLLSQNPEILSQMEASVDATVWDKTVDKDESPSAYPVDTDKIPLPKNIKSSLEKEIKELQKSSEDLLVTDYNTAEFQNNVANAMIDVLNHLSTETEHGMKMAQVCITKYMSPIVQKFPAEVYDFILHGGYDTKKGTENSLVSMFKEIKAGK